jgi:hypothetical protein
MGNWSVVVPAFIANYDLVLVNLLVSFLIGLSMVHLQSNIMIAELLILTISRSIILFIFSYVVFGNSITVQEGLGYGLSLIVLYIYGMMRGNAMVKNEYISKQSKCLCFFISNFSFFLFSHSPRKKRSVSPKVAEVQPLEIDSQEKEKPINYEGEYGNLAILLLLYVLQGIPLGMSGSLNLILKERNVSYTELGKFSFASWPFALKLLWAPLVDSVFVETWGRRKTWMVPAQLLIGVTLIFAGTSAETLVYAENPDITTLTAIFFWLYFLCATQDVAVDGWGFQKRIQIFSILYKLFFFLYSFDIF